MMRKTALAVLVLLLVGLMLVVVAVPLVWRAAPPQVDSDAAHVTQVDTSHYPQVTLYMRVDDGHGTTQSGLHQQDFEVTEDGTPVDITGFNGSGASQVSTLLLIDRSGSMDEDGRLDGAKNAAQTYIHQMRPADRTAVMAFSDDITLVQPFTSNADALDDAIDDLEADGATPLYDSLVAGVDALQQQSGRRALVVLTDGRDCSSKPCARHPGSNATLDQAIAHAKQTGLDVQVIGLGDRSDRGDDAIDEPVLRRIASETGGAYFYAPSADELAALYARLGGSFHDEYALTYTSPRASYDGTRRDIRVSVAGSTSTGGYTEPHLINVQANTLVGLGLLLPLLGALAAPGLLRRKNGQPVVAAAAASPAPIALTPAFAGTASDAFAPLPAESAVAAPLPRSAAKRLQPEQARTCQACGTPLRPGAQFCGVCGAAQTSPAPVAQQIHCDQCGKPLLPGARFCDQCGAAVSVTR